MFNENTGNADKHKQKHENNSMAQTAKQTEIHNTLTPCYTPISNKLNRDTQVPTMYVQCEYKKHNHPMHKTLNCHIHAFSSTQEITYNILMLHENMSLNVTIYIINCTSWSSRGQALASSYIDGRQQ